MPKRSSFSDFVRIALSCKSDPREAAEWLEKQKVRSTDEQARTEAVKELHSKANQKKK